MRVRCYLSGNPIHDRVICAFYEGCPEEKKLISDWQYEPSDIAVVFGIYKSRIPLSYPRGRIISQQRQNKLDVLVLETGYVNRGDGENHHYAAGFNGLNGRADFRNRCMPDDRLRKLGITLKPWRVDGVHVVLCGQVPWDASVDHVDFMAWLQRTADELNELTGRTIRFRPHPLAPVRPIAGCGYSLAPLQEDLKHAWACVTFNSNSAVEAAIEGVPVFAFDAGSMALPVANTRLQDIEHPIMPERALWLADLAYCQWTQEEMSEGLAWNHLINWKHVI